MADNDEFVNPDLLSRNIMSAFDAPPNYASGTTAPMPQDLPEPSPMDTLSKIQQIFGTPREDVLNQFLAHLSNQPVREKPGLGRRILGSLAGLGAYNSAHFSDGAALGISGDPREQQQIQDMIANKPYYEKLQDWEVKLKPLEKAAGIEGQRNTGMRTLNRDILNQDLYRQRLERLKGVDVEKARHNVATEANARETNEQRAARTAAMLYHYKNPNHQLKQDADGNLIGYNPKDDTIQVVKDPATGQPIKGNALTPQQRVNMGITLIQERTKGAKEVAAVRGEEARKTRQTVPAVNPNSKSAGGKSEAAKQKELVNRATKLRLERPDLAPYVKIEGNQVSVSEGGGLGGGAKRKALADEARKILLGNQTNEPPKAPEGWEYVAKPGGGWTAVEKKKK
jgi:hypothetical protein